MSLFQDMEASLNHAKCKTCGGLGKCDDAGDGDIYFNEWKCTTCRGSGINPSIKLKMTSREGGVEIKHGSK